MKIVKFLLCILFMATIARADTSVVNSGVNDIINNAAPTQYNAAASKAAEAALMQLGITKEVNTMQNLVVNTAQKNAEKFIDQNLPMNHQTLYFLVGSIYTVGYQKSLTGTFDDPIFHGVKHDISVNQNSANLNVKFSF